MEIVSSKAAARIRLDMSRAASERCKSSEIRVVIECFDASKCQMAKDMLRNIETTFVLPAQHHDPARLLPFQSVVGTV